MIQLTVKRNGVPEGDFRFDKATVSIGRGKDVDLVLAGDAQSGVSRNHAIIEKRAGGYFLLDRGSANGSKVNGKRQQSCPIRTGDVIGIDPFTIEVVSASTGDLPGAGAASGRSAALIGSLTAIIVIAAGLGAWVLLRPEPPAPTPAVQDLTPVVVDLGDTVPLEPEPEAEVAEAAADAEPELEFKTTFMLPIYSNPAGAAIWVNGTDIGMRAPAVLEVTGSDGQVVSLQLRRDGRAVHRDSFRLGATLPTEWAPEGMPPRPVGADAALADGGGTPPTPQPATGDAVPPSDAEPADAEAEAAGNPPAEEVETDAAAEIVPTEIPGPDETVAGDAATGTEAAETEAAETETATPEDETPEPATPEVATPESDEPAPTSGGATDFGPVPAGYEPLEPGPTDWSTVVGARACNRCHGPESSVWVASRHATMFDDLHRTDRAREIMSAMGVRSMKREGICMNCHYQPEMQRGNVTAVAGVSCESCHGPAAGWIEVHSNMRADPDQKWEQAEAAGMIRPARIYNLATNCYGCHTAPNEQLVNEANHPAGSDFELLAWSQGQVRHNFAASAGSSNDMASPERARMLHLVGRVVMVEYALRGLESATAEGTYFSAMRSRAEGAIAALDALQASISLPEVAQILETARAVRLAPNNAEQFRAAANRISVFGQVIASNYDGSGLAALDSMLPSPDSYKGTPAQ